MKDTDEGLGGTHCSFALCSNRLTDKQVKKGSKFCSMDCVKKHRRLYAKTDDQRKAENRLRAKQRADKRRELGCCVKCGGANDTVDGGGYCTACLALLREWQRNKAQAIREMKL